MIVASVFGVIGPSPDAEQEVPHDAGSLRARGRVGEPGAEREAPDDAEHADDRADQRGPHGHRAPAATGLDREAGSDGERGREPELGPPSRPDGRRRRVRRIGGR